MMAKAKKGYALYRRRLSQDGHISTIPGDFLIDEKGNLEKIHYGKFIGDHMNIEAL
jgi:peroxiredoxin Q/BCP